MPNAEGPNSSSPDGVLSIHCRPLGPQSRSAIRCTKFSLTARQRAAHLRAAISTTEAAARPVAARGLSVAVGSPHGTSGRSLRPADHRRLGPIARSPRARQRGSAVAQRWGARTTGRRHHPPAWRDPGPRSAATTPKGPGGNSNWSTRFWSRCGTGWPPATARVRRALRLRSSTSLRSLRVCCGPFGAIGNSHPRPRSVSRPLAVHCRQGLAVVAAGDSA
jgi:hypothetical protein